MLGERYGYKAAAGYGYDYITGGGGSVIITLLHYWRWGVSNNFIIFTRRRGALQGDRIMGYYFDTRGWGCGRGQEYHTVIIVNRS